MFCAEEMDRTNVLIRRDDADAVFLQTLKSGVLHPAAPSLAGASDAPLCPWEPPSAAAACAKRRARIEALTQALGLNVQRELRSGAESGSPLPTAEEFDLSLARIGARAAPLLAARDALREQRDELKRALDRGAAYTGAGVPLLELARSQRLVSRFGVIDGAHGERLKSLAETLSILLVVCGEERGKLRVACVALREQDDALDDALRTVSFQDALRVEELRALDEAALTPSSERLERIESDLAHAERALNDFVHDAGPELARLTLQNDAAEQLARLGAVAQGTDTTCVFGGWTPRGVTQEWVNSVLRESGGRAVVETGAGSANDEAPALYRIPTWLEPFERIVDNYGAPVYSMVNPAPFVAVAFLAMFGMMFGDMGHGAVLLAAGLFFERRCPAYWTLARLMSYCGAASMVFGALFGSVFGFEDMAPALWLKPAHHIGVLFVTTVAFGVALVSVGIALNIVNALRSGAFLRRMFDLQGPIAGTAYWVGVALCAGYALGAPEPALRIGVYLLCALLACLTLKGPALRALGLRVQAFPEGFTAYAMEALIETAEFFTGYLANTVSFVRVAAFGLAHAGLLTAVFGVSELVASAPLGWLWSGLVIVAGNVFVIVFEGAVVTIQILRLEYYEFFGKFFSTFGVKYAPVRSEWLVSRAASPSAKSAE